MTDILIDRAEGVLTLTLNRVEKKNSFTQAMYTTMADALADAVGVPESKPAVLRVMPAGTLPDVTAYV